MAQRAEGDARIRRQVGFHGRKILPQSREHGARQQRREAGGLGDAEKLGRRHFAAQRMRPSQVTHLRDQTAALEIVAADVAQADLSAGDRVAELVRDVEACQGAQLQRIREEINLDRIGAARLRGRRAGLVERDFGVLPSWPRIETPAYGVR